MNTRSKDPGLVQSFFGGAGQGAEIGRGKPAPQVPSPDQRAGNYKTTITTFFTQPGVTSVLYQAVLPWTRLRIYLETAGPAVIGTGQQLSPVFSGKGALLPTDEEVELVVSRGNKVWIFSTTANRIRLIAEPVPWLEQLLGGVVRGFDMLIKLLGSRK